MSIRRLRRKLNRSQAGGVVLAAAVLIAYGIALHIAMDMQLLTPTPALLSYLENLSAGLVGTGLAALVASAPFAIIEGQRRNRLVRLALEQLHERFEWHVATLMSMYWGACSTAMQRRDQRFDQFFDSDYYEQIQYLDFRAKTWSGSKGGQLTWVDMLALDAKHVQDDVKTIREQYGGVLDTDFVETLVRLSRSEFLRHASAWGDLFPLSDDNFRTPLRDPTALRSVKHHIELLLRAIVAFHDEADQVPSHDGDEWWRRFENKLWRGMLEMRVDNASLLVPGASRIGQTNKASTVGGSMNTQGPPVPPTGYQPRPELPDILVDTLSHVMANGPLVRLEFAISNVSANPLNPQQMMMVTVPMVRLAMTVEFATQLHVQLGVALATRPGK